MNKLYIFIIIVLSLFIGSSESISATPQANQVQSYKKACSLVIQDLFQNYNQGRFMDMMSNISSDYNGSNRFDKGNLANSVSADNKNLRINLTTTSIDQVRVIENGDKINISAQVSWNRRADFMSVSFNRWKTSGKAEMVFEIVSEEPLEIKLLSMRGDFPFGLTTREQQIIISSGTLNGVEVTTDIIMEDGEPDFSGSTTSGTSSVDNGSANSFDFSKNRIINSGSEGDIFAVAGAIRANVPAGIQLIAESGSLDSIKSVPTSGYSTAVGVMNGYILAVKTKEGNYAKIRVISIASSPYPFQYVYQEQKGRSEF